METSGHGKKVAESVFREVEALARQYGADRLGFVTLTFPCSVRSLPEAQDRWHSLRTHILSNRYVRSICVVERHKSGGIHWHLVVVLPERLECFETFDHGAWIKAQQAAAKYGPRSPLSRFYTKAYGKSACPVLRREWAFWATRAPAYGFGRVNTLPVRKNGQAVARYLAKYCTKCVWERREEEKGARLVRFVGYLRTVVAVCAVTGIPYRSRISQRTHMATFGWATLNGRTWRAKVRSFVESLAGVELAQAHLRILAGAKWAFKLRRSILLAKVLEDEPEALRANCVEWRVREAVKVAGIPQTQWEDRGEFYRGRQSILSPGGFHPVRLPKVEDKIIDDGTPWNLGEPKKREPLPEWTAFSVPTGFREARNRMILGVH